MHQGDPSLADRQGPAGDLRRLQRRPAVSEAIVRAAGGLAEPARTKHQLLIRLCSTSVGRLGWIFRDHWQFARTFSRPQPPRVTVAPALVRSARLGEARLRDLPAVCGGVVLVGGALGVSAALTGATPLASALAVAPVLSPFLAAGLLWAGFVVARWWLANERLDKARQRASELGASSRERWEAEKEGFYRAEHERLKDVPEWGPITVAGKARVDIFGGRLRSWCGLLTTFLTSVVHPGYPAVALDLTGSEVVDEALRVCGMAGRSIESTALPEELGMLVRDLDAQGLTDMLIDLIHGTGNVERAEDRVVDTRLLRGLCGALEPAVTLERLRQALQEMLGEESPESLLTERESRRISSGLFGGEFVQQAHGRLRVLEAYVSQLVEQVEPAPDREAGEVSDPEPEVVGAPPDLRCVMLGRRSRAAHDLLANLAVQWATREVEARVVKTVVVAGGDRVPLPLLELLSRRCQERQTQLVVMFEHLRDEMVRFVGGGPAVGFMTLGNHLEAEAAANYIGRSHRFVLSQVTKGYGAQASEHFGTNEGGSASVSETRSMVRGLLGFGWREKGGLLGDRERSFNATFGTNWGSSIQYAESTNWNFSESSQRVYEYAVEPSQLQGLPEYAMLLVTPEPGGPRITSMECCPDIATLPHVSPVPFDRLEPPAEPLPAGEPPRLPARGEGS